MTDPIHSTPFSRDPSGFVFRSDGLLYRQVNQRYAADYDLLLGSGLYKELTEKKLLIPHEDVTGNAPFFPDRYKTLLPDQIPVLSYPYEWGPSQLRDAARLTLTIMQLAMEKGLILKDATPYNVQFYKGRPVFIDTLSFQRYDPTRPWIAYRQFCEQFLFPLALQHYLKLDIHRLQLAYPEGIPAGTTGKLLPARSRLNMGIWMHVFLQSQIQPDKSTAMTPADEKTHFSHKKLQQLVLHLRGLLKKLETGHPSEKGWSNYYEETILGPVYLQKKEEVFMELLNDIDAGEAIDLGSNDGYFSLLMARKGLRVIAVDADWQCIETLYVKMGKSKEGLILPLCADIANLSPAGGFFNTERKSLLDRLQGRLVTALALVHHLVLGNNIPLPAVAAWFARLTRLHLLIEFVPLSDEKAQMLIRNKEQVHHEYSAEKFEECFTAYFIISRKKPVGDSGRTIYHLKKREGVTPNHLL